MNSDRIKEIQHTTAYPDSISVQQALLQVWNECEQDNEVATYTGEDMIKFAEWVAQSYVEESVLLTWLKINRKGGTK